MIGNQYGVRNTQLVCRLPGVWKKSLTRPLQLYIPCEICQTYRRCLSFLWKLFDLLFSIFDEKVLTEVSFSVVAIVWSNTYSNQINCHISITHIQYIPRNMHTVFALLCFVVVRHWLIFPYPSGLLHRHCGNLTIAPVPTKQPWWIWINTSCEFIMNDCITTTKQRTTKPCAYFLGYTVYVDQFGVCQLQLRQENIFTHCYRLSMYRGHI